MSVHILAGTSRHTLPPNLTSGVEKHNCILGSTVARVTVQCPVNIRHGPYFNYQDPFTIHCTVVSAIYCPLCSCTSRRLIALSIALASSAMNVGSISAKERACLGFEDLKHVLISAQFLLTWSLNGVLITLSTCSAL